ncbi:hypothetical protein BJV77DRAFT_1015950 [Russula vinacea]|nr:hypothetical protein BJV77DRAFT_1015950 [Russula vinacea]
MSSRVLRVISDPERKENLDANLDAVQDKEFHFPFRSERGIGDGEVRGNLRKREGGLIMYGKMGSS